MNNDSVPSLMNNTKKILEEIGLSADFFDALLKEDSWSFVIKTHALLEASLTYLLVKETNLPKLEKIFSNLELGNGLRNRTRKCKIFWS